jgi:hypothetical protein
MHEHAWGILLASGRESRLQGAVERMTSILPVSRMVAVVRSGHRPALGPAVPVQVIEEPGPRGAALPVLVAALHAQEHDPLAVLIVPSDPASAGSNGHGLTSLDGACHQATRHADDVLVLRGSPAPLMVARAAAVLRLARMAMPEAMPWLDTYRQVLHAVSSGRARQGDLAVALSHLYSRLPRAGFGPLAVPGATVRMVASHGGVGPPRRTLRSSGSSGLSFLH